MHTHTYTHATKRAKREKKKNRAEGLLDSSFSSYLVTGSRSLSYRRLFRPDRLWWLSGSELFALLQSPAVCRAKAQEKIVQEETSA